MDTVGLRQPSAQDKQTNGEQIQESSKLFELYLILKAIHGMILLLHVFLELFRHVCDA